MLDVSAGGAVCEPIRIQLSRRLWEKYSHPRGQEINFNFKTVKRMDTVIVKRPPWDTLIFNEHQF